MARPTDSGLETRILDAAQALWIKGGTTALTIRAVAKVAGTTPPTVYQRFQSRQGILRGLLLRVRNELMHLLQQATSPEDMCERYLQYALHHAHEYELFFAHSYEIFHKQHRKGSFQEDYPGRELARRKLAEFLGGSPHDYTGLHLALWSVLHGTSMLLISETVHGTHAEELQRSCRATVRLILKDVAKLAMPE